MHRLTIQRDAAWRARTAAKEALRGVIDAIAPHREGNRTLREALDHESLTAPATVLPAAARIGHQLFLVDQHGFLVLEDLDRRARDVGREPDDVDAVLHRPRAEPAVHEDDVGEALPVLIRAGAGRYPCRRGRVGEDP